MRYLALLLSLPLSGCITGLTQVRSVASDPAFDVPVPERQAVLDELGGFRHDGGSLFAGRKARAVGDVVTVLIVLDTEAGSAADTSLTRSSDIQAGLSALFGIEGLLAAIPAVNGAEGSLLNPEALVGATSTNDFDGSGGTSRSGQVRGTLSARIVGVLPNGLLEVAGRQAVRINEEVEFLAVRGIVDPRAIRADNSVLSSSLADLRIEYSGTGVVAGKQRPGVVQQGMDLGWPF